MVIVNKINYCVKRNLYIVLLRFLQQSPSVKVMELKALS
jgi:hypothetical protein